MEMYPRNKPCDTQTPEQVTAYYRSVKVGDVACVRETHAGFLRYYLDEVVEMKPRSGRVYLKKHGGFFAKSGSNCFAPTGQCKLVVPTKEIIAYIEKHPPGSGLSYSASSAAFVRALKGIES